jgi:hypothetical protein
MRRFEKKHYLPPDAPLKFEDHGRPLSRRQFIRQGFMTGSATLLSAGMLGLFANPNAVLADVAPDLDQLALDIGCDLAGAVNGVPFICFDLAGGANLAGSNVLVGQGGGQMDLLPGQDSSAASLLNPSANNDFINDDLKLLFHADSPMLRGILERAPTAVGSVDGCVIPARSDNDTANNTHNPLYALAMAGARGEVVDLIGSRNSESGGNSMAPPMYIDPEFRPTKVDRPSDVTGMVDVGNLTAILGADDVTAVMEAMARVSHKKLKRVSTGLGNDAIIKDLVRCGYLRAADLAERFARRPPVDPLLDTDITSIFSVAELNNDSEFAKTASVMKMVVNRFAAAGCITMGGYDYHTGDRVTGENRDLRAGRCIGACLEYAAIVGQPLMVYVFSDGSVFSNGNNDDSPAPGGGVDGNGNITVGGRGKGQWTGDNSSTACSFYLVYRPGGPSLIGARQIGHMSADASVATSASPAANNPNLLVNLVTLNYMALNGQVAPGNTTAFTDIFPNHGLGSPANLDSLISFGPA